MVAPAEKKVTAGAMSGAVTGLVIWALVAFVPSFRAGVPGPVAAFLPFALAWLGHVIAAYQAPHTHRPDLSPPPCRCSRADPSDPPMDYLAPPPAPVTPEARP